MKHIPAKALLRVLCVVVGMATGAIAPAQAATVTVQGSAIALTHVDQLNGVLGTADFDTPADPGIAFHNGVSLDSLLPGIDVSIPPPPIQGGDAMSLVISRVRTH